MIRIDYHIRGAQLVDADAGARVTSFVQAPASLKMIQDAFPFEGSFHFRAKTPGSEVGFRDIEYLWVDLLDEGDFEILGLRQPANNRLVIRALAVDVPVDTSDSDHLKGTQNGSTNQYQQRISNVTNRYISENSGGNIVLDDLENSSDVDSDGGQRESGGYDPDRTGSNKSKGIGGGVHKLTKKMKNLAGSVKANVQNAAKNNNVDLDQVKSGATSIWNAVWSTAEKIQTAAAAAATAAAEAAAEVTSGASAAGSGGVSTGIVDGSSASKAAKDTLALLSEYASCTFDPKNLVHKELLRRLWHLQFPDQGQQSPQDFQVESAIWKQAGWQKADPTADLKTSGMLALHMMSYFAEAYSERATAMLENNRANTKQNYPFAIVGVNVSLLLIELFHLKNGQYLRVKTGFWEMFREPLALSEIFCICFIHIDALWSHRKAVRADFAKIIGEVKGLLYGILGRSPRSVEEFKQIAMDEGMTVLT